MIMVSGSQPGIAMVDAIRTFHGPLRIREPFVVCLLANLIRISEAAEIVLNVLNILTKTHITLRKETRGQNVAAITKNTLIKKK